MINSPTVEYDPKSQNKRKSSQGESEWPTRNYDNQNTGWKPQHPFHEEEVELAWRSEVKSVIEGSICVADNTAYFGEWDGSIQAVNTQNGNQRWILEDACELGAKSPTITDSVVLFATLSGIITINRETSQILWERQERGEATTPRVDGGVVYAGREYRSTDTVPNSGTVQAYDLESGEPLWSYSKFKDGEQPVGEIALSGDRLYTITSAGTLLALSTKTGEMVWSQTIENQKKLGPVVRGDSLYLNTGAGLQIRSLSDGRLRWESEFTNGKFEPIVTDTAVLSLLRGEKKGNLVKYDRNTLSRDWKVEVPGPYGSLTAAGNLVFVGGDYNFGYDIETGEPRLGASDTFASTITVGEGKFYVYLDGILAYEPTAEKQTTSDR